MALTRTTRTGGQRRVSAGTGGGLVRLGIRRGPRLTTGASRSISHQAALSRAGTAPPHRW
ncbi:hypothetical protein GLA29479_4187 [Lysobacter antibioticus]|nr:hypothetical protein GLA29479_4187 [Lysobacter antibioticus]